MHELHCRQYQAQPRFQSQPHSGSKWLKPAKIKITSLHGFHNICPTNMHNFRFQLLIVIKVSMNLMKTKSADSISASATKWLKIAKIHQK